MKSNSSNLAFISSLIVLFASVFCVLLSAVMYCKYSDKTYYISSTQPFVLFSELAGLYDGVATVRDAWNLQTQLMNFAWCTDFTGNYDSHPESSTPACSCINHVYVDYMLAVMGAQVNDSYMFLDNATSLVNVSTQLLALQSFFAQPWIPNALVSVINESVVSQTTVVSKDVYQKNTILCLTQRSTWKEYDYFFRIHPLAMFFYTSFALFLFSVMYFFSVQEVTANKLERYALVFFNTTGAVVFLLIMNPLSNWIYAIALLGIFGNYCTSIDDEYSSVVDTGVANEDYVAAGYEPVHPLKVGLWYYLVVFFPILVVYIGLCNLVRDMVALFGLYILGYLVVCCMQRYFWVKFVLRPYMPVEIVMRGYQRMDYYLQCQSSHFFGGALQKSLSLIFFVLLFFLSVVLMTGWYHQDFYVGNYVGLASFACMVVVFLLEFSVSYKEPQDPSEHLPFSVIDCVQVLLSALSNIMVLWAAIWDSTIV